MNPPDIELSIVVPFYNEEPAVGVFFEHLLPVLRRLECAFEVVCINDGSTDATLDRLLGIQRGQPGITVVELARNFGKEAALKAGLDFARGRAIVPMDCDLQDPPDLIPELVQRWREGFEVVHARRKDRSADSVFKRITAAVFYRLHNRLADVPLPEDVGDFGLMDRKVADVVRKLPERHRFMRGLVAWAGFRSVAVEYERRPRPQGYSKYNFLRMWNFAIEGLTGFSTVPLRVWTYIGAAVSLLSFVYGSALIAWALFYGRDVPGYTSTMVVVLFLGGLQLIGIGLLGEYLGRTYSETKQRPIYVVRDVHRQA